MVSADNTGTDTGGSKDLSGEERSRAMDGSGIDPGRPPKVLVTKIGFDGHDRGSRIVATFLRDAGMEVVYTGPWQSVSGICTIALQEDVDVIGISSLAADHLIVPKLMDALRAADLGHIQVVVGGIVPDSEIGLLTAAGVARIYHPGATRQEIVDGIATLAALAREQAPSLHSPSSGVRS